MKRSIAFVLMMTLLLVPWAAMAQSLEPAEEISVSRYAPEGANEENADYIFRCALPQFTVQSETDEAINAYYRDVGQDLAGTLFDQSAEDAAAVHEDGMPAAYTQIDYQITCNDERYLSVTLSARQFIGNGESETMSATSFARDGLYAGQPLTLSQVLGLEQEGDELSAEQTLAEQLAYRLVWEIVREQMQNVDGDYLDGLTQDMLTAAFSPETDFYLDGDGNIVFFIQAGVLAGEVAGILTFPFAPAELLSAVKE